MSVEWIAGVMIVLAVVLLGGAAFLFFRESWLIQWLRGTAGFLLAGMAFYLAFLAASIFSFQQVAGENPLATLSFERKADQLWVATVAEADGSRRQFEVAGDLWQLDVRLLRWRGLFTGAAPGFQLERLSGRYASVEDEATKPHNDYLLPADPLMGFDLWQRAWDDGSLLVDAKRSSVMLVPMAEGAIFEVVLGENGLAVRGANSVAEDAMTSIVGAPAGG